jgi:hypothetical protein
MQPVPADVDPLPGGRVAAQDVLFGAPFIEVARQSQQQEEKDRVNNH